MYDKESFDLIVQLRLLLIGVLLAQLLKHCMRICVQIVR